MSKHQRRFVRHDVGLKFTERGEPFEASHIAHHLTGEMSQDGNQVETWCGRWLAIELALHRSDAVECADCLREIAWIEGRTSTVTLGVMGGPASAGAGVRP